MANGNFFPTLCLMRNISFKLDNVACESDLHGCEACNVFLGLTVNHIIVKID